MIPYVAQIGIGRARPGRLLPGRIAIAAMALAAGCAAALAQDGGESEDAAEASAAQDGGQPGDFVVGAAIGLGVEHVPDDGAAGVTWQSATLAPELTVGRFRLGLAVKLRFRFDGGPDGRTWEIRDEDWRPDPAVPGRSFFDLYLPIIRYAHYGLEGEPLVVRLGSYDYASLGSGFVVGDYSNTRLLPARRLFGVDLDVDGAVFNFPVLGLEGIIDHLPAAYLRAGRLWGRPLYPLGLPLFSAVQVGVTAAADYSPFQHDPTGPDATDQVNVSALGADVVVPIVAYPSFTAATHGDVVLLGTSEADSRSIGTALGVRGSAIEAIRYGFQLRLTDDRFLPVYFDQDYDLLRADKYRALRAAESAASGPGAIEGLVHLGWAARFGLSLLDRRIDFDLGLAGPLTGERGALAGVPHAIPSGLQVQGRIGVRDLGIEGMSVAFDYRKRDLDGLGDLFDAEHLSLGTSLSYRTGSTVLTVSYRGHYDPAAAGLVGAPSVESWIKPF